MRRITGTMALAVAVLFLWTGAAQAQGSDDPLLVTPEVFIIVDTSGSMTSGSFACGDGNFTCNRRTALREVLTGTYHSAPPNTGCPDQSEDGILDVYRETIRFGFATFDNDRASCTGLQGTNTYNYPEPNAGDSCSSCGQLGIKGRNDTGGRLVDLVDPSDPDNLLANNARVQQSACSTSAQGCTPINAALWDARYYFNNWHNEINYDDPIGHCRARFVLLMTDGQNNGVAAHEYGTPEQEAAALFGMGIPVFVVGFGGGLEAYVNPIARAGSGNKLDAFIAESPDQLRMAFDMVLKSILAGATSRTEVASAPSQVSVGTSYSYAASFEISLDGIAWRGQLYRYRIEDSDEDGIPEFYQDPSQGFHEILTTEDPNARRILTISGNPRIPQPMYPFDASHDDVDPMMCLGTADDQVCVGYETVEVCEQWTTTQGDCLLYDWKYCSNTNQCTGGNIPPFECLDLGLPGGGMCCYCIGWTCWCETECVQYEMIDECTSFEVREECTEWVDSSVGGDALADTIKDFVRGVAGTPARGGGYERTGPELGDIFHSNPTVVQPPSALTTDYKFEAYYRRYFNRDTMVYVGANDGMLHAFVGEDNNPDDGDRTGRELWAFIPANLLAKIQKVRWGHEEFVDATPVVRHVYFTNRQATDVDGTPMVVNGVPIMGAYRTVLVSGERGGGNAYFALDVSDPDNPEYLWEYRTDILPTVDYQTEQCDLSPMETWASPVVGQVWLKRANPSANENPFTPRSVAILPGGFYPPENLAEVDSCVEFVEMMIGATSVHIIDIETGKLLKKFTFAEGASADLLTQLEEYYARYNDPSDTGSWSETFKSDDFTGGAAWAWGTEGLPAAGWYCMERRDNIKQEVIVPPEQMTTCVIAQDDDEKFVQHCCCKHLASGGCDQSMDCNPNAVTSCLYEYTKYKNTEGGIIFKKKGECLDNDEDGDMVLRMASDWWVESVSGTPAAYDTTVDRFLTRVFVPTSHGKVWRIELNNGVLDMDAPEGEMVQPYTSGGFDYGWDVGRDSHGDPVPWFNVADMEPACVGRPIMVNPTLALNYQRNLVLYFGTGRIDNLEWTDTTDCFYAIEETRSEVDGQFILDAAGQAFGTPGNIVFPTSERLYGKPLVAAGHLIISTYTPDPDECLPGTSHTYMYRFDDFSPTEQILDLECVGCGAPSSPQVFWTPTGPKVVLGSESEDSGRIGKPILEELPGGGVGSSAAHVLHWSRVM